MTDTEKQIENMGYKVRVIDMLIGYVVYENMKEDQEIVLEWDDEDQYCLLFSRTISIMKGVIFYEYGSMLRYNRLYEIDQEEISVDTYIYHTESSFCRGNLHA